MVKEPKVEIEGGGEILSRGKPVMPIWGGAEYYAVLANMPNPRDPYNVLWGIVEVDDKLKDKGAPKIIQKGVSYDKTVVKRGYSPPIDYTPSIRFKDIERGVNKKPGIYKLYCIVEYDEDALRDSKKRLVMDFIIFNYKIPI